MVLWLLRHPLQELNNILDGISQDIAREMTKEFRTTLKGLPIEIVDVQPMLGRIHVGKEDSEFSLALIFHLRIKDAKGRKEK